MDSLLGSNSGDTMRDSLQHRIEQFKTKEGTKQFYNAKWMAYLILGLILAALALILWISTPIVAHTYGASYSSIYSNATTTFSRDDGTTISTSLDTVFVWKLSYMFGAVLAAYAVCFIWRVIKLDSYFIEIAQQYSSYFWITQGIVDFILLLVLLVLSGTTHAYLCFIITFTISVAVNGSSAWVQYHRSTKVKRQSYAPFAMFVNIVGRIIVIAVILAAFIILLTSMPSKNARYGYVVPVSVGIVMYSLSWLFFIVHTYWHERKPLGLSGTNWAEYSLKILRLDNWNLFHEVVMIVLFIGAILTSLIYSWRGGA